jgi:hypothetical protein
MKARADGECRRRHVCALAHPPLAAIEQEIRVALADGEFADLPTAVRECERESQYLAE